MNELLPAATMSQRTHHLSLALLLIAAFAGCAAPRETDPGEGSPLPEGDAAPAALPLFSATMGDAAAAVRERVLADVDARRLSEALKVIAGRPNVAGTVADFESAQTVHQRFLIAGLESRIEEYEVLLPYPQEVTVELVRPVAYRAPLEEAPLDTDFDTHVSDVIAPLLAYSPDRDVTGRLVYVNYATEDDFGRLRELGVRLDGAIGIARYGRIYRGSKLKHAAAAKMAALLIYSDPADDGYVKGDVYPDGPWRPRTAIQRGSVLDISHAPGDPLTPGSPSFGNAQRIDVEDALSLPTIPAVALSHADAQPFLEHLGGPGVPEGWQGGLPLTYHLGGDDLVTARVRVRSDWRIRKIWNVIAHLRGSLAPDSWILVGSHRDAWVHGAADPGSGTVLLLETARVLGQLARDGLRPTRSIVFCSWDAEEFGLLGSVEHVEHHRAALEESAALYLNCDAVVTGSRFTIGGDPVLGGLVRSVLEQVPDDREPPKSLWASSTPDQWRLPGGGSDHVPFVHLLAVPCLNMSSSGPYGVYHSLYDTYGWVSRIADPGFAHHARVTRVAALLTWSAASATVMPYDFAHAARWIRQRVESAIDPVTGSDLENLRAALDALDTASADLMAARKDLIATDPDPAQLLDLNRMLAGAFRLLLKEGLLPDRPFYRNILVAVDAASGYEAAYLPALQQALAANDPSKIAPSVADLAHSLANLAGRLAGLGRAAHSIAGAPAPRRPR